LGYTPKCPIDTSLAELGTPHDFRDGRTIGPQSSVLPDLFHLLLVNPADKFRSQEETLAPARDRLLPIGADLQRLQIALLKFRG
jgi:hypothetical protein